MYGQYAKMPYIDPMGNKKLSARSFHKSNKVFAIFGSALLDVQTEATYDVSKEYEGYELILADQNLQLKKAWDQCIFFQNRVEVRMVWYCWWKKSG